MLVDSRNLARQKNGGRKPPYSPRVRRPTSSRRGLLSGSCNSSKGGISKKNTVQVITTTCKIIEYKVINSHAIQSQTISKFTGNMSKNTGKFTSETNQVRGPWGGLTPPRALLEGCTLEPTGFRSPWPLGAMGAMGARGPEQPWGWPQRPYRPWSQGKPSFARSHGGEIHSREGSQVAIHLFPGVSLPDGPPKCSGTVRGSRRGFSPIVRTFLGDILVIVEF